MAICPSCYHGFHTLEDEEGTHNCPHCGYGPSPKEDCIWCGAELEDDGSGEKPEHYPYCSDACAVVAERENEEETALDLKEWGV